MTLDSCAALFGDVERMATAIDRPLRFGRLWGASHPMRRLLGQLDRIGASDATLLIDGETGTGKTAVAEAIHDHGRRRDRPLVVVDCGALPPSLLEAELFGHERGAFPWAKRRLARDRS